MPKITVDGIDYNTEDLSDNGKAQLASLQFLEAQMNKLNAEISVYETARSAYVNALKSELDGTSKWFLIIKAFALTSFSLILKKVSYYPILQR